MKVHSSICKTRTQKVQEKIIKKNLKALIVYSNGNVLGGAGLTHGYLEYLCNWDSRNRASILILFPDREPLLLVSLNLIFSFAKETLWFKDVRLVLRKNMGQEIASILKPNLSKGDKIGYIGMDETPAPLYETLIRKLEDVELIQANQIIDDLTMVKDNIQIAMHRRAAEICDEMFITLSKEVRKHKRAYQLQADMEHTAKCAGCEYASTFLTIGPIIDRARYSVAECSRIPHDGDSIMAGLFIIYKGHWGHAVRTGSLGKPSRAQQKIFDIVYKMQEASLKYLQPGRKLTEVKKAAENVRKKLYPDCKKIDGFSLKLAHSIGHHYDDPILTDIFFPADKSETSGFCDDIKIDLKSIKIQPDMLFELHPNLFITNEAGAMTGDMVLINENGNEILNQFPRELISW